MEVPLGGAPTGSGGDAAAGAGTAATGTGTGFGPFAVTSVADAAASDAIPTPADGSAPAANSSRAQSGRVTPHTQHAVTACGVNTRQRDICYSRCVAVAAGM